MSMEPHHAATSGRLVRTGIAATALTVLLGAGALFIQGSCAGAGKGPPSGPIQQDPPPGPQTPQQPDPPDEPIAPPPDQLQPPT